ncbi:MAG TPA: glycosyltransferase [Acidimicrobiia bacterium]|nr:glycosyltransferase [Acidimicrobiia bacterium]
MRICLIAHNRFHTDRTALTTHRAWVRAGHEVTVVAVDSSPPQDPVVATVTWRLFPDHPIVRWANRLLPRRVKDINVMRRLGKAAAETGAHIFAPLHADVLDAAVDAATRTGGVVLRTPRMKEIGPVDLISLAPSTPELATPVAGVGEAFTPGHDSPGYPPKSMRHRGMRAVLCYRKTAANPGRYLESALFRAGVEIRTETDSIDLSTIDPDTAFVLFVESPYPAIEVTGTTSVPVLFWVHHGEHHLPANLRLTDRYQADTVLLAHSWHLAPWFPTPVHRFPFAIPTELFPSLPPLDERQVDVAMVGSKLRGDAWQYRRRRQIVEELEKKLPADRVKFIEGIPPEEMARIYTDSRIVINEGGVRHFPITMRVFEAVGAGAVLLTDHVPGLDMIFQPEREYVTLTDHVVSDVTALLGDLDRAQVIATRATDRALNSHTYDHRVDLLMDIAAKTAKRELPAPPQADDLTRLITNDVEVQRILHDGVAELESRLPDREVWDLAARRDRLHPKSMDAVVITDSRPEDVESLIAAARRYVYIEGDVSGLDDYLATHHPRATKHRHGRLTRIDLMTEAYRVGSSRRDG